MHFFGDPSDIRWCLQKNECLIELKYLSYSVSFVFAVETMNCLGQNAHTLLTLRKGTFVGCYG